MSDARPALFATATTAQALEQARAVVVLVGSYDGSGNYGDIAQLGAALALLDRLGPEVVALPVLEREYLATHRQLTESSDVDPRLALFFDPAGELEDDLLPAAAPVELAFGAGYLYGGGYLNRHWGARKLAMLAAAEELLAAGGAETRPLLSSGLQVEPEWVAGLGEAEASMLRRCEPLGARDGGSRQALAALGPASTVLETGDDAIGLLGRLPAAVAPPPPRERLLVNVHIAEHDWVTDRPQALLGFYLDLLEELGRLAGRPLLVRPLVAYEDGRVDEHATADRLHDACGERGIEVGAPRLLRPAGLGGAAPELRAADLTVSCSYHIALTALMLAVPTVVVADNPYYEQKAAGLMEAFGLPAAFTATSTADPVAQAREVAAFLLDADRRAELRGGIVAGGDLLRQRRAAIEAELLARLGGAVAAALGARTEELAQRLRRRSTEPAQLQVRLSELQTELEEQRRLAGESPLEAELRVQEAEARAAEAQTTLATALRSRSWRLTSPLRRLGALLRRLRPKGGRGRR